MKYLYCQSLQKANHEEQVAAYKEIYGPKPDSVGKLWICMQTTDTPGAKIFVDMDHGVCLDNLHTTLYFARHYPKYFELETVLFKFSKTITKWMHFFIKKIQALKAEMIVWSDGLGHDNEDDLKIVTVATFCCEPAQCRSAFTGRQDSDSEEEDRPVYVYEITRNTFDDKVFWMKGPLPNGLSKTTIFNVSGLRDKLGEEPAVGLADNAYTKEQNLWTPGPAEDPDHEWKRKLLAHHEMRQYKMLQQKYHHSKDPKMHNAFFEAIVVFCQMNLDAELEA